LQLTVVGIENLWRLPLPDGRFLFSGGQPEGDAGFESLKQLGIRTVMSVDGAVPDLETAKQHGLRYVHLPIGYDDVPAERLAMMVAAVKTLPGPVFVHCHHGKHRSPAAAVCLWRTLRHDVSEETAQQTLRVMGTAEKYSGLYRAAKRPVADAPSASALEFPEVTAVAPLADQMVAIDQAWERIRALTKAESRSAAPSLVLEELWTAGAERFRESARLSADDSEMAGLILEMAELWETSRGISAVETRCVNCHRKYRD